MLVTINLCKCIYTFNDYSHMLLFNDKEGRNNYFNSNVIKTFDLNITYDDNLSEITVPFSLNELKNINYLFFDDKYFFIDEKLVLTDVTSKLIIRLDVLQTYLYDCLFFPSFVDRCHVPRTKSNGYPTDEIVSEGLAIGDYIVKDKIEISDLTASCVLATTTPLGKLEENIDFNPVAPTEEEDN